MLLNRAANYLFVENWPLSAALVLGLISIYLLLPRTHRVPPWIGAVLGGLALVLAGVGLLRAEVFTAQTLLFDSFAAVAVISGTMLITQSNPVHAALSFVLVVMSTGGLFLLLAAPFIAAATLVVYAGAIIVTFLFVIMLAQQVSPSNANDRSREPLLSALAGFVLLAAILLVLRASYVPADLKPLDGVIVKANKLLHRLDAVDLDPAAEKEAAAEFQQLAEEFKTVAEELVPKSADESKPSVGLPLAGTLRNEAENALVADPQTWPQSLERLRDTALRVRNSPGMLTPPPYLATSALSGPPSNTPVSERRLDRFGLPAMPAANSAYLGRSLFTDNLLAIEIAGFLLLVATIGAIVIATRRAERAG